ncbi:DNA-directed RNA polymerase subunit A'' [Candidatus Woesearchaeota archaeon]|nr:DNA-directed RNA polymerase subunit A'' [Candidatus Woesearchaeota archaeon]
MAASVLKELKDALPEGVFNMIAGAIPDKLSESKAREVAKRISDEYGEMKVEPGESVGLVAAESIGEPGTQMSIDYEERVIIKTAKGVRAVKIGEFVDVTLSSYGFKKLVNPEQTEVYRLPKDAAVWVPSLSQTEKIVWKRVTAVSRHQAPSELLRITMASGRRIVATPYHSFVLRQDNKIVPVAGSKLKEGDRIPVLKSLDVGEVRGSLALEEFLPKEKYIYGSELKKAISSNSRLHRSATIPLGYEQINNYANSSSQILVQEQCVYPCQNHSRAQIPEVMPFDSLFGWLVGAYLAEGVHVENSIGISNISEPYLARAAEFAAKYKIGYNVKHETGEFGPSATLWLHSTVLADLLKLACGRKSSHKRVPQFAFDANEDFIANLLQAYFDGDGNVSVTRNVIRASSNSEALIDGISLLLTRLGIFSVKNADKKGQHWISVSYRYSEIFLRKIGSSIPAKKSALIQLAANLEKAKKEGKSYDAIDMIPGYGNIFLTLGRKLGLPSRLVMKLTKKQKVGRTALQRYVKEFASIASQQGINIEEELALIRKMVDADIVWDEIIALEYVKPSTPFVYDFSVEETETFTTFDGVVTHNTLDTFHFAGVSAMNVTMGLPRIIEILDGRKNLTTPMMEIYLKKPYAEGQDIKKAALMIRETKLQDIATEFSINVADNRIEAQLDVGKMKELGINEVILAKALKVSAKGVTVEVKGSTLILKVKTKEGGVSDIFKLKEKAKEAFVKGVRGVTQVLPVKKNNEYVILTFGSNLKKVLQIPFVDETRTKTNDVFEIEETLGIEAARQAVIDEVFKVIETQGLNVDIRHLMLVADVMCADGKVKGITRYGVVRDKASVLARASFETPIKHIINASLYGEVDKLTSVVENVMLNQPVPIGTGLPKLISKNK